MWVIDKFELQVNQMWLFLVMCCVVGVTLLSGFYALLLSDDSKKQFKTIFELKNHLEQ
jgi:hypothetical protein